MHRVPWQRGREQHQHQHRSPHNQRTAVMAQPALLLKQNKNCQPMEIMEYLLLMRIHELLYQGLAVVTAPGNVE
jgi:hypothetical protein